MNANLRPLCVCPSRGASLAGHHDPTEQRRDGTLLLNHRPILAAEADQKPDRAQREPGGEPSDAATCSTTADAGLVWPDLAYNLWLVGAAPHWSRAPRRAAWAPFSTSAQVQFFTGPPSFSNRAVSVSLLDFFYPYLTVGFISVWMSVFQRR